MLELKPYTVQEEYWPQNGRHILAHHDRSTVVVYQALPAAIADFALEHQRFGGAFSYERMSWIKPNFLWMMFRSGWATKPGQERILAVKLERPFFESLLTEARPWAPAAMEEPADRELPVRLQWDSDHDPLGTPVERRAIQLGLQGSALREYGTQAMVEVEDITPFVAEQRENLHPPFAHLMTPDESELLPAEHAVAVALGLDC